MDFWVDRLDLSQVSVLLDRLWITVDARFPSSQGLALSEWIRAREASLGGFTHQSPSVAWRTAAGRAAAPVIGNGRRHGRG